MSMDDALLGVAPGKLALRLRVAAQDGNPQPSGPMLACCRRDPQPSGPMLGCCRRDREPSGPMLAKPYVAVPARASHRPRRDLGTHRSVG